MKIHTTSFNILCQDMLARAEAKTKTKKKRKEKKSK